MLRTGMAIRTAYNNQGWANRCKNPEKDTKCFKCLQGGLFINDGKPILEDKMGYCKGDYTDYPLADITQSWCWEQTLCTKFVWGNVRGKWREAYKGMHVYFLYVEQDFSLTLWGHSVIDKIDNKPDKYPPIFFKPFAPLPQNKWIEGLSGKDITGKKWGQGHFRYLNESQDQYLFSLISGVKPEDIKKPSHAIEPYEKLEIELKENIKQKLEKISNEEGREVKELVREAIAKLINERKS